MKLYLSSMHIPNSGEFLRLVDMRPEDASVALIPNAKDYLEKQERDDIIGHCIGILGSMGLEDVNVLDLRDYRAGSGNSLRRDLKKNRVAWGIGGNTFLLRDLMRASGFEDELPPLLEKDELIYGGYSAGAIVAGRSLDGFDLQVYDDPKAANEIITDGMNLVPYTIIPHVGNPDFPKLTDAAHALTGREGVLPLTDSQAAVFNDGRFSVVEAAA